MQVSNHLLAYKYVRVVLFRVKLQNKKGSKVRKTMVMKYVRKHMVMMMGILLILILNDVQANDLASTSFSSSSPPILFPYPFELDEATGAMHKCFADNIESCPSSRRIWPFPNSKYSGCAILVLLDCIEHFHGHVSRVTNHMFMVDKIMMCVEANCYTKKIRIHIKARARLSSCLLKCYEEGIKGHALRCYLYK